MESEYRPSRPQEEGLPRGKADSREFLRAEPETLVEQDARPGGEAPDDPGRLEGGAFDRLVEQDARAGGEAPDDPGRLEGGAFDRLVEQDRRERPEELGGPALRVRAGDVQVEWRDGTFRESEHGGERPAVEDYRYGRGDEKQELIRYATEVDAQSVGELRRAAGIVDAGGGLTDAVLDIAMVTADAATRTSMFNTEEWRFAYEKAQHGYEEPASTPEGDVRPSPAEDIDGTRPPRETD